MGDARVTVIVLNWNGKQHLDECLQSVLDQKLGEPFEVLLWDNGSTDGSQAFVRERFPGVRVHDAGQNLGFAKAMNRAIALVKSEYVVLLNNDTRAEPEWLAELVRVADHFPPDVLSVGSRMVLYDRPEVANHVGGLFSPFGGAYDEGLFQPVADFAGRPDVYETGASCGGAALYRRDLFLSLRGFDERYFLYFEDADLCRRGWIAGYTVLHAARSVVRHKLGASTGAILAPWRLRETQKNRMLMLHRTAPSGRWVPRLALATLWTTASGMYLLLRAPRSGLAWFGGWSKGAWPDRTARGLRQGTFMSRKRSEAHLRHFGFVMTPWRAVREANRLRKAVLQR